MKEMLSVSAVMALVYRLSLVDSESSAQPSDYQRTGYCPWQLSW